MSSFMAVFYDIYYVLLCPIIALMLFYSYVLFALLWTGAFHN